MFFTQLITCQHHSTSVVHNGAYYLVIALVFLALILFYIIHMPFMVSYTLLSQLTHRHLSTTHLSTPSSQSSAAQTQPRGYPCYSTCTAPDGLLDIAARILAADHEADLARWIRGYGGVSVFDNGEDFFASFAQVLDKVEVEPLVLGCLLQGVSFFFFFYSVSLRYHDKGDAPFFAFSQLT